MHKDSRFWFITVLLIVLAMFVIFRHGGDVWQALVVVNDYFFGY